MGPIDSLWHLLNFVAPALAVGALLAAGAKLIWRRELAAARFLRLAMWASAGGVTALVVALLLFGRDGTVAGYALLVAACALALWWRGFIAFRAR
jgi:hypothetical protein